MSQHQNMYYPPQQDSYPSYPSQQASVYAQYPSQPGIYLSDICLIYLHYWDDTFAFLISF